MYIVYFSESEVLISSWSFSSDFDYFLIFDVSERADHIMDEIMVAIFGGAVECSEMENCKTAKYGFVK